ncbi:MAG TPA: hypothetical protein VEB86_05930, partial [Chryseosolibacter sp.]|nr:hypothetical protein [Chryseosolibacter sp.]
SMLLRCALSGAVIAFFYLNSAAAQDLKVDVTAVKELVSKWNDAHTLRSSGAFSSLYSDKVKFYGSILPSHKCISTKEDVLKKRPGFHQKLNGDLVLTGYSNGVIRCDFVKSVTINDKVTEYNAYLVVKELDGNYYIVEESDLTTDRHLNNHADLGSRVAIKDARSNEMEKPRLINDPILASDNSMSTSTILFMVSLAIGVTGLVIAFRLRQISRSSQGDSDFHSADYAKGLAFEKFVAEQFDIYRDYFILLDWRSDKSHQGIFPKSNQNPDLVYEYRHKNYVRRFAVECKFRSKAFKGTVRLMDESNYRTYKTFHENEMPVYIALGFAGQPNDPEELYLIPFEDAKHEMMYKELSRYRKPRKFYYDMERDRLT